MQSSKICRDRIEWWLPGGCERAGEQRDWELFQVTEPSSVAGGPLLGSLSCGFTMAGESWACIVPPASCLLSPPLHAWAWPSIIHLQFVPSFIHSLRQALSWAWGTETTSWPTCSFCSFSYSVRLYPGVGGNLRKSDTSVQTITVFSKSLGGGPLRLCKYPASLKFLPLIGASISGPWLHQAVFFAAYLTNDLFVD